MKINGCACGNKELISQKIIAKGRPKVFSIAQKAGITLAALLLVMALVVLDRLESHYLSLLMFYLVPITLATWYVHRFCGYCILSLSVLAWLYDDIMSSNLYARPEVPYWDIAAKAVFCVIFINLLNSLKRALDVEKKFARIDYLTETANLRYFFDIANMEISKARRHNWPLTLAYLDLDNFKYINDRFGHEKGNELLKLTAHTIKESLRNSDIIARVGGDEFAIIFPQTDQQQTQYALKRLKQNVSNLMTRYHWHVTFSMGVITCNGSICSFDTLMTRADDLMYAAKKEGKNTIKLEVLNASANGLCA